MLKDRHKTDRKGKKGKPLSWIRYTYKNDDGVSFVTWLIRVTLPDGYVFQQQYTVCATLMKATFIEREIADRLRAMRKQLKEKANEYRPENNG